MGDATPEDVIAEFIAGEVGYGPTDGMVEQARELRAALAAAGFAVVPAADVDAAARLRELLDQVGEASPPWFWPEDEQTAYRRGWDDAKEAAAAVGSVDPEGEADDDLWACSECSTCVERQADEMERRGDDFLKVMMHTQRMIVCPTCGNKRCPKATDHRLGCTGSNEPNQPGSSYQYAPARPSVDPEGDPADDPTHICDPSCRPDDHRVVPARPLLCPTCGSDDPEVCCGAVGAGLVPHPYGSASHCCPDTWHSPDRGDR